MLQNLKRKENQERLLEVFRKHINTVSFKSILDDFLQEYVINEDDHEEISGVKNRTKAAQLLFTYVERSSWLSKLIPILKAYEESELVERLQQTDLSTEDMKGRDFYNFLLLLIKPKSFSTKQLLLYGLNKKYR